MYSIKNMAMEIINAERDTAEVKFQKFGIKKVYIKYLLPKI